MHVTAVAVALAQPSTWSLRRSFRPAMAVALKPFRIMNAPCAVLRLLAPQRCKHIASRCPPVAEQSRMVPSEEITSLQLRILILASKDGLQVRHNSFEGGHKPSLMQVLLTPSKQSGGAGDFASAGA
jgi:hypothetical protein